MIADVHIRTLPEGFVGPQHSTRAATGGFLESDSF
jgi:hypothetical protein